MRQVVPRHEARDGAKGFRAALGVNSHTLPLHVSQCTPYAEIPRAYQLEQGKALRHRRAMLNRELGKALLIEAREWGLVLGEHAPEPEPEHDLRVDEVLDDG